MEIEVMKAKAELEILGYLQFEKGWDGYRGGQFNPRQVQKSLKLLEGIELVANNLHLSLSEITPGPCGDGSLDIETSFNGNKIIFTLAPDADLVHVYTTVGDYEEKDFTFSEACLQIPPLLYYLGAPLPK